MKKITLTLLTISLLISSFAFAKNTGTGEEHKEKQIMEILSEDVPDLGLEDVAILSNQVIVLDIDGNILLKASLEAVENGSLPLKDLVLVANSERVIDNLGDQIFIKEI